jgi:hypothetical protein
MFWSYIILSWIKYLCSTYSYDILVVMCNIPWYEFIWCDPRHITCHVSGHRLPIYDKILRHNNFATSSTMWLATWSNLWLFVIKVYHITCHITIGYVAMLVSTNCDVFRMTYDKIECHRFSDEIDVCHKIYDDFLMIVIVVYLTRTFCDDDLFITTSSPKYNMWQINSS